MTFSALLNSRCFSFACFSSRVFAYARTRVYCMCVLRRVVSSLSVVSVFPCRADTIARVPQNKCVASTRVAFADQVHSLARRPKRQARANRGLHFRDCVIYRGLIDRRRNTHCSHSFELFFFLYTAHFSINLKLIISRKYRAIFRLAS